MGAVPGEMHIDEVKSFWEAHPVAAAAVPYPLGTTEYFAHYDGLREANESQAFSAWLHEYDAFAGKSVLDVGCGNGYVLANYARAGARVTGVDLTEAAVRLARQRFVQAGLVGAFQTATAEALPFSDDSFDCVCSMGVLHHTPDTARAVAEIWRVLRPGGRLIVMFYHRDSALYRVNFRLQQLFGAKSLQQLVNEVDGIGNPKGDVYSRTELEALLENFVDLEMFAGVLSGWMVLPRGGRFLPQRLLQPLASRWGWFLYAKGRKQAAATSGL
ncbi:MAG: class I SAM-dependent methyltransferase [Thermomicrobiales bacterium]